MKKRYGLIPLSVTAPIAVFIILCLGGEIVIRAFNISPHVLPAPSVIFLALWNNFGSVLYPHFLVTLYVILLGFIISVPLGILFAAVLSQFNILNKAFSPYIILLVTTPAITLVPLFMMWLGFGTNVRVIVVVLQAIPIVTLNSITGFNTIEKTKLDLAASMGSNKLQTFIKIIFPNALSNVFTGIKLGAIFATIAAISAEFCGSNSGLGNRVQYYAKYIDTDIVFACILLIAIIGITLYLTITAIQNKVIIWKE